jgi:hypothetical protein
MVTFACLLHPDRPVDLPLVMLPGFPEHRQEHDLPISSTLRDPRRNITEPDPQLPDRSLQVIGPRTAEFGAFLGEHAAYLVTISRLRRKLGDPPVIETQPGAGYHIS